MKSKESLHSFLTNIMQRVAEPAGCGGCGAVGAVRAVGAVGALVSQFSSEASYFDNSYETRAEELSF